MTPLLVAVTVGALPVPVGTRVTSSHTTSFELTIRARAVGRTVQLGKQHAQRSDVQVQAVAGALPTRVELGWEVNHLDDHGPDGSRSFDLPVVGRRYVVDKGAGTVARTEGGGTPEELEIAASASDLFGLLGELRAMLGTVPLQVGDTRPAGPMFAGLIRDAPGTPVSEGTLTVTAIGDETITLDLAVQIVSSGELQEGVWADVVADLSGVVEVEIATGWTRRLVVAGPVELTGHATPWGWRVPLSGGGRFRSDTELQFTR